MLYFIFLLFLHIIYYIFLTVSTLIIFNSKIHKIIYYEKQSIEELRPMVTTLNILINFMLTSFS